MQYLSCPSGHEWELDEETPDSSRACPFCGEVGETVVDVKSISVTEMELPPLPIPTPLKRESENGDALPRLDNDSLPNLTFDDFKVEGELGRGGMGVVYLARQLSLERKVALKMIASRDANSQLVTRLKIEAESVARLNHPNIAQIYEIGESDGLAYFAMEFVDGKSLADLLRDAPMPGDEAARLIAKLAIAMDYAHQRDVIHRDLKPANILIDNDSAPKITDFGLAKRLDQDSAVTRDGSVMGTPSYMAPEQASGNIDKIDSRTDVYGLGAVLYDVLTGRPPHRGQTPIETLRQVLDDDPVSPRLLNQKIDRDLNTICLMCLEKEPGRRYQSAMELAEDLQRFLDDRPINARPSRFTERSFRWCRRNPWIAGALGVATICLAIAFSGVVYGYFTATSALSASLESERQSDVSFRDALNAVNNFYKRVGHETLLNQPGMHSMKERLLSDALGYYRKLLDQRSGDATLTYELAEAQFYVGEIKNELGEFKAAIDALNEAKDLLKTLQNDSSNTRFRSLLGDIWTGLGRTHYRMGKLEKAESDIAMARKIRERLAEQFPQNREIQRKLANAFMNAATISMARGQSQLSLAHYETAQRIREGLARKSATQRIKRDLAKGYLNWANLAAEMQQIQKAKDGFAKAAALLSEILHEEPLDLNSQFQLGICYRRVGDLEEELKPALTNYDRARDWLEPLAEKNPDVAQYQAELAALYLKSGDVWFDQEKFSDAHSFYDAAHYLYKQLQESEAENPDFAINLKIAENKLLHSQKQLIANEMQDE